MTKVTLTCPDCGTEHTVYKMNWNILWCAICNFPIEKSNWIISTPTTKTND